MWRILDRGFHVGHVGLCTPISGVCIRISDLSLAARGDVAFCSETHVSSRPLISELMIGLV